MTWGEIPWKRTNGLKHIKTNINEKQLCKDSNKQQSIDVINVIVPLQTPKQLGPWYKIIWTL